MKLGNYCEIIGTLESIDKNEGCINLILLIKKEIEIPINAIPQEQLHGLLGKRVGVFNCNGDYKIRMMEG